MSCIRFLTKSHAPKFEHNPLNHELVIHVYTKYLGKLRSHDHFGDGSEERSGHVRRQVGVVDIGLSPRRLMFGMV